MAELHFVRLRVERPALMRFAQEQGLLRHEDEGFGYVLHAWLAAMFGQFAPKPFRHFERRGELLAYACSTAKVLAEHAQMFAPPIAHAALVTDSLASKSMPEQWRMDQRLHIEVLACPVSRKDGVEKDVFLRALDRLGKATPERGSSDLADLREKAYLDWFQRQWQEAIDIEHLRLAGLARGRLLRRGLKGGERSTRSIERPQVLFDGIARVRDPQRFAERLARGVGRHRAFGFGMVLLAPAP